MRKVYYDKKQLFTCLFIIAFVFGLMKVTGGAGFAIVIPMTVIALVRGRPEELFFYMLLIISVIVANPNLVPKGGGFSLMQRGLMSSFGLVMTVRVLGKAKAPLVLPFVGILVYAFYMVLPSAMGWCPIISFMKLLLFLLTIGAYLGAANDAAMNPRENLPAVRAVVLAIAIVFIWGSIALLRFPAYGIMASQFFAMRGEKVLTSYFMGMTSHSQCMGPVISGLAVLLFADWIFGIRKFSWLYVMLLAGCPILIFKTSSRTAMLTFIAGLMFVMFFFGKARWVSGGWKRKIMGWMWIFAICVFCLVIATSNSRERFRKYLMKHDTRDDQTTEVTAAGVASSRMGVASRSFYNFKEKPIFGNGFQVTDDMKNLRVRSVTDLLSAPIEKGVWVTAVLEEGGVLGFVIFLVFLINLISKMIKYRAFITASVFFVFLVSNMGEFSFFSMSYLGGFMWALVFAAVVLDSTRAKAEFYAEQAMLREMQDQDLWVGR